MEFNGNNRNLWVGFLGLEIDQGKFWNKSCLKQKIRVQAENGDKGAVVRIGMGEEEGCLLDKQATGFSVHIG